MAWRTRGHRGDVLEELIVMTNEYYNENGFARVDKISTPVKVIELNERSQITLGYYEKKSTVDFIGIAQGIGLCFDAKETNLLSIPLSNIHSHQLKYMQDFAKHGGLAFLIVHFKRSDDYFLVPLELIEKIVSSGKRKSIPYQAMKEAIPIGFFQDHYLNYLAAVNVYLDKLQAKKDFGT